MAHSSNLYHRQSVLFFSLLTTFVVGAAACFVWVSLHQERDITSYALCLVSKKSNVVETQPQVCVTAGGKRFVEPDVDEEVQKTSVPAVTSSKEEDFSVASTSARTFGLPETTFSLILPEGWIVRETETIAEFDRQNIRAVEILKTEESREYPIGRIVINYMTPGEDLLLEAWRNNFIPSSVPFRSRREKVGGINLSMVESSKSGTLFDGFRTQSYFGVSQDKRIAIAIFSHFQNEEEQSEQKAILSSISFERAVSKIFSGDRFTYRNSVYESFTFSHPLSCALNEYLLNCPTRHGTVAIRIDAGGHGGGTDRVRVIVNNERKIYPFGEVSETLIELVDLKKIIGTYWITKTSLLSQEPIFGFEIYPSPSEDLEEIKQIMDQILSTLQFVQ